LKSIGVSPEKANPILVRKDSTELTQQVKLNGLVSRPQLSIWDVLEMSEEANAKVQNLLLDHEEIVEQAEIQIKYEGYIQREEEQVNKQNRLEEVSIPASLDYTLIKSLSIEAKEKLSHIKPITIGQAARVSGVSPSDISVLLIHLGR
jgi:tRNA uridine 5-carboxymethylaminomethyl modification enzyme